MKRSAIVCGVGIVLSLIFSACTIRPHAVLSSREMEDVLYDLHRTEGILQAKGYGYNRDQENAGYYEAVLRKHGVTQAQFDSSIVWYTDNPRRFDKIYPRVIDRLNAAKEVLASENSAAFAALSEKKPVFTQAKLDSAIQVLTRRYRWTDIVDTIGQCDVAMVQYVFPLSAQDSLLQVQQLPNDSVAERLLGSE